MIQKDGVQRFATRCRQSERHVADAKNRVTLGQRFLDQPDSFDGFSSGAHIVHIARTHRKHQWIENQVFRQQSELVHQEIVAAPGNGQFAFTCNCHAFFVNRAHHKSGAVFVDKRNHSANAFLTVLQIDRIDDRLALTVAQTEFQNG